MFVALRLLELQPLLSKLCRSGNTECFIANQRLKIDEPAVHTRLRLASISSYIEQQKKLSCNSNYRLQGKSISIARLLEFMYLPVDATGRFLGLHFDPSLAKSANVAKLFQMIIRYLFCLVTTLKI
jgi:hypothetical protein